MALVQDASFNVNIRVAERDTNQGIGGRASRYDHIFEFLAQYANGTGNGKIGAVWSNRATLSSPTNLDLSASLSAYDGSTVSFPIVMGIGIINLSTTVGEDILVGGGSDGNGTSAFVNWVADATDKIRVKAGGFVFLWAPNGGYAVTNSTADILRLAAESGSPQCDVLIIGRAS